MEKQIRQPPFHCHSFQPPFISVVTKKQKNMDFLFPLRGLSSSNPVKREKELKERLRQDENHANV